MRLARQATLLYLLQQSRPPCRSSLVGQPWELLQPVALPPYRAALLLQDRLPRPAELLPCRQRLLQRGRLLCRWGLHPVQRSALRLLLQPVALLPCRGRLQQQVTCRADLVGQGRDRLLPVALVPCRGRLQQQVTCRADLVGQGRVRLLPVALVPCRERLLQQGQHSMSGPYPAQRLPPFLLMQQDQLPGKTGAQHLHVLHLLKLGRPLVLPSLQCQPSQRTREVLSGLPSQVEWLKSRLGLAARIPLVTQVPACRPPAPCSQLVTAAQPWPPCQLRSSLLLEQEA